MKSSRVGPNRALRWRRDRRRICLGAAASALLASATVLSIGPSAALVAPPSTSTRVRSAPWDPSPSPEGSGRDSRTNDGGRLVCRYADERLNIDDIELAFHDSPSSASSPSSSPSRRRRLRKKLRRAWRLLREGARARLEGRTVYVLECESGKYYVGSTANRRRRLREHFSRRGSRWTKRHRPLRVLREHRRVPPEYLLGMESRVTAECMLEFGVNNVRGSMFCAMRDYHVGDIKALTKFLGHYCGLSYRKVNSRLSQTLPLPPERRGPSERIRRWKRS